MKSNHLPKKSNHLPKKIKKESRKAEQPEPKWFEKQITSDQFEIKQGKNGKFYSRHKEWKNNIWIGPYDSKEAVDKVINSYVSVTKKPFGEREPLKNVRSFIGEVV